MEARMKIKSRQDFLVALTIAAAGLFVAVNFIFAPLEGWWTARSAQIRELRERVRDGKTLLTRESNIRSHWDEMRANALPANTSLAEQQVLKAFDGWSLDSSTEITSMMPQWQDDSTNYMTLACRVEAAGSLGTLSRFLYEIEKGPMALRLDTVELTAHDNDGQQFTLGLEVNGLALMQQDKK
jgi:Tfp pilus assembly protein PilO